MARRRMQSTTNGSNERVNKSQTGSNRRNPPPSRQRSVSGTSTNIHLPPNLPPSLLDQAMKKPEFAAKVSTMHAFAKTIVGKGIRGCTEEFKKVKATVIEFTHTAFNQNIRKCRYKDVFCMDKTRIVLKEQIPDFIHANYVRDEILLNAFICCQGPLLHTCKDFWAMVWQERCIHIFMLCKFEEQNKAKCERYFPTNPRESVRHGRYRITNAGSFSEGNLLVTRLVVTRGKESRFIEHRQWVTWPDRSIPQHVEPAFRLLDLARAAPAHPTVVHCSAGIGRTGTLVLIEYVLRSLEVGTEPIVPALLLKIRQQRVQAVQTEDQYIYVHWAILQKILSMGMISAQEAKPFCLEYEKYLKTMNSMTPIPLPPFVEAPPTERRNRKPMKGPIIKKRLSEEEEKKEDRGARGVVVNPAWVPPREGIPDLPEVSALADNPSPPSTMTCVDVPDPAETRHKPEIYFKKSQDREKMEEKSKLCPPPTPRESVSSSKDLKKNPNSESIGPCPFKGSSSSTNEQRNGTDGLLDKSPTNKSSKSSESSEEVGSVYYYPEMCRTSLPFIKNKISKSERRRRSIIAKKDQNKDRGSSKEPSEIEKK